jgi:hypothetical protein
MELEELLNKIILNKEKLVDLRSKSKNLEEYQKTILRSVEGFLAYLEHEVRAEVKNRNAES